MKVLLQNVRIARPRLMKPEAFEGSNVLRYSAAFLIEKGSENDKNIRTAISSVAKETFSSKAQQLLKQIDGNTNKMCYTECTYEDQEDMMHLSANRNGDKNPKPAVIDRDKTRFTEETYKIYGGCYVNASVDIWGQTGNYTGIRCELLAVQFVKDGEAFGGSAPNLNDFEAVEIDLEDDAEGLGIDLEDITL